MYRKFFKRVFDIIVSLIAAIFIIIVAIPVAIAIKVEDGGSVFYCGERYGKDMKKFRMIKFRSMKMNSQDIRNADGTTYNSEKDPRMTKIGAFLRKCSIDELPQFFNVLKGDMSIIGPRPSPMGNEKTYTDVVKRKFNVRPGITGLNQALLRNSATLEERYKNDVYYADNVSFKLDVKIFFMTISTVLFRKNVFGGDK
ncbi:MAG: sugar transferase [Ruminococcaceae bacterium]|nr:sugar transferase [Oscillospiraceae bacterium]